jgi:hypothetical protein
MLYPNLIRKSLIKRIIVKNLTGQISPTFFWKKLAKISPIRKTIKLTKNYQETVSERFFRPDEIELSIGSNCEIIFFANWPFLGMRVMRRIHLVLQPGLSRCFEQLKLINLVPHKTENCVTGVAVRV